MSSLSPRLHLKLAQKQILTPSLVQMVTLLQLNRVELRELIANALAENPLLEEASPADEAAEVSEPAEEERDPNPADAAILETIRAALASARETDEAEEASPSPIDDSEEPVPEPDPFEEIDFGSFFEEYLDPGYKAPAVEQIEKPSFETFLSAPLTLAEYLRQQLALVVLKPEVRAAAEMIIGNLDENGYLTASLEELAADGEYRLEDLEAALKVVHTLDPAGVGARDLRECLLLQLESRNARGSVAWEIVANHLHLLEAHKKRELAKVLGRPMEHIETAIRVILELDPRPGLRFSGPGPRTIEPDVYFIKEGDDYIIQFNDDDLPQLRINPAYRYLIERDSEPSREVRQYIRDRYAAALQLIKNIEQRKQTILRVCQVIVQRQREFLDKGIEYLRPLMIKEVAAEIGVHPSTVSRAVANKYAHTPQGVFELRFFFSEGVQGPSGATTPLLVLKRKVRKMIEEEDPRHPLTDEQITQRLRAEGFHVTRRTVAKYREDMGIPSTHHRRVRD